MNVYDARLLGNEISDHLSFEVCWVRDLDSLCWIWTGKLQNKGYGYLGDRTKVLHRYAYRILIGPIAEGLVLDHLCRRRDCCNPAHVEPVTQQVNCQRGADAAKRGTPPCNSDEAREEYEQAQGRDLADAMEAMLATGRVS